MAVLGGRAVVDERVTRVVQSSGVHIWTPREHNIRKMPKIDGAGIETSNFAVLLFVWPID